MVATEKKSRRASDLMEQARRVHRDYPLAKVVPYWLVVALLFLNRTFDLFNVHIHLH